MFHGVETLRVTSKFVRKYPLVYGYVFSVINIVKYCRLTCVYIYNVCSVNKDYYVYVLLVCYNFY